MGKMSYVSELWKQKQKKSIQEQCYKYHLYELSSYIKDFAGRDSYDPISFYDSLSSMYSELAEFCYLETENLEECRLYYYLAAKAGEMMFLLSDRGVPTSSVLKNSILKNEGAVWYALCAILAGEYDMAIRLAPKGTVLKDFFEGKDFEMCRYTEQSEPGEKVLFLDGYKALFDQDGKTFGEKLAERIRNARNMTEDVVIIDVLGTALLKLAKKKGIICEIKAAELPEVLLEQSRVNFNENILPEYKKWSETC